MFFSMIVCFSLENSFSLVFLCFLFFFILYSLHFHLLHRLILLRHVRIIHSWSSQWMKWGQTWMKSFRSLVSLLLRNQFRQKITILREFVSLFLEFRLKLFNFYLIGYLEGFDWVDMIDFIKTLKSKSEWINLFLRWHDLAIRPHLQMWLFE